MKKHLIYLLIACMLSTASCSNDSESRDNSENIAVESVDSEFFEDTVSSTESEFYDDVIPTKDPVAADFSWKVENGVLYISGNGSMPDFSYDNTPPWDIQKESITKVVINEGITSIGDKSFSSHETLISVDLPDGVKFIGNSAFGYCQKLSSITLPDSVISIGDSSFYNCDSITEIIIPNRVISIGSSAFEHCDSIVEIHIPKSVKSLGECAFGDSESLKKIFIPASDIIIDAIDFAENSALEEINVDPDNKNYSSDNGILFNKDKTVLILFPMGKKVDTYSIPDSVTKIEMGAFSVRHSSLKTVTIGKNIAEIESAAFLDTSVETINYNGTKAQWEAILKWEDWSADGPSIVVCSDGTVKTE